MDTQEESSEEPGKQIGQGGQSTKPRADSRDPRRTMRLFVAFDLPFEMTAAVFERAQLLRESISGRFTRIETYHVTIAFLGDTPENDVDSIARLIDGACEGFGSFQLELGEVGCFGRRNDAVLWQGFKTSAQLDAIAKSVRECLGQGGVGFDGKPFKPHITLARRTDLSGFDISGFNAEHAADAVCGAAIDSVSLYRSVTAPEGARYTLLHRAVLEGSSEETFI